jgi:hypothetical protein
MPFKRCLVCHKKHTCDKHPTETCLDPDPALLSARLISKGICPGYGSMMGRCTNKVEHGSYYCDMCRSKVVLGENQ